MKFNQEKPSRVAEPGRQLLGCSLSESDDSGVPSGYLTVRHGKIHHAIKNGKAFISMGHGFRGELLNNQMVLPF